MLDLAFVRENLELVKRKMSERGLPNQLEGFERFDSDRRRLLVEAESRKARRNKVSDEIARLKKEKQDASGLIDRKSTRLNSSHVAISYAVFCLKKKKTYPDQTKLRR